MLFTYLMDLIYLNHRYFWLACLSVPRLSRVFEYVVEACLCSIIDAFLQDICLTVLAWIRSQRKVRRLVCIYTWKPFYMLGCTLLLYLRVSLGRAFLLHQHYLWKIPQRQQQFPVKFSLHRVEYLLIHGTLVCVCVCVKCRNWFTVNIFLFSDTEFFFFSQKSMQMFFSMISLVCVDHTFNPQ